MKTLLALVLLAVSFSMTRPVVAEDILPPGVTAPKKDVSGVEIPSGITTPEDKAEYLWSSARDMLNEMAAKRYWMATARPERKKALQAETAYIAKEGYCPTVKEYTKYATKAHFTKLATIHCMYSAPYMGTPKNPHQLTKECMAVLETTVCK